MMMKCQIDTNEQFRNLLLLAFNQGSKDDNNVQDICAVYRESTITGRTALFLTDLLNFFEK